MSRVHKWKLPSTGWTPFLLCCSLLNASWSSLPSTATISPMCGMFMILQWSFSPLQVRFVSVNIFNRVNSVDHNAYQDRDPSEAKWWDYFLPQKRELLFVIYILYIFRMLESLKYLSQTHDTCLVICSLWHSRLQGEGALCIKVGWPLNSLRFLSFKF